MRHITEAGLDVIKYFEKFYSKPYICPAGFLTIGYGHVILSGENFTEIDKEKGLSLLAKDVQKAEMGVLRLIRVPLEDHQFDALVSWTFNLGSGRLQSSTLRMKVNREEHEDVPDEIKKWRKAGGRVLAGLVKRRAVEARMYAGDA